MLHHNLFFTVVGLVDDFVKSRVRVNHIVSRSERTAAAMFPADKHIIPAKGFSLYSN